MIFCAQPGGARYLTPEPSHHKPPLGGFFYCLRHE
jgi:hypothetical protein